MDASEAIATLRPGAVRPGRSSPRASDWGSIGALCESSRWLARRLQEAIGAVSLPIVELGAGYGSVTRVLPESTISLERDAKRYAFLKQEFPERTILSSCALPFLGALSEPAVVVSSIPSVNNPEFGRLRAAIAGAHNAGMVQELITYTYFPHNPFTDVFAKSKLVALEMRNLPPAFVWKYTA